MTFNGLNIVVMVKVVPKPEMVKINPETNTLERGDAESIINPPDKNAIEVAVSLKEKYGGKVTLVSMAPPFVDDFMRLMMAMGADEAIILSDREFAMADTYPTTMVLAEGVKRMKDVDIVICGEESSDGGTGNVPPGIAEWLNWSQATYCVNVDYDVEKDVFIAKRSNSVGFELISFPRPAVISVEHGINSPRFPDFEVKKDLDANYEVKIWSNKDLKLDPEIIGLKGSLTLVDGMESLGGKERKKEYLEDGLEKNLKKLLPILAI